MSRSINIHFLGAAGTVTGSKYLVKALGRNIMIDCGLFQGLKSLRELNWDYLPVNVPEIDALILTHGHLDHTGYIPRLIKEGFKGKIHATGPTLDIAEIILKDSGKIQEEEAERANRSGYSKHKVAKPLYDVQDVENSLSHFSAQPEGKWINLYDEIKFRLPYNGHIIGATSVELDIGGKRLVFSGDIGRENDMLLYKPKKPEKADILCIESTYGNRLHPKEGVTARLKDIIINTVEAGGTILIPSFAVERTQMLMYMLWKLQEKQEIPDIPIIMDSPMGANVLNIFHHNREWHKLVPEDCSKMCEKFRVVKSIKETWDVRSNPYPKIIIAGSGMITGGRILSYLEKYLGEDKHTLILVGFQANGTRGRKLLEGANELKIYGKYYPVKAKIENINGLSAHADQKELLNWMGTIKNTPEKVFIVHGEANAADSFRVKLKDTYHWDCSIPSLYDIYETSI